MIIYIIYLEIEIINMNLPNILINNKNFNYKFYYL